MASIPVARGGYVIGPGSVLPSGRILDDQSPINLAELADQLVCRRLPLPPPWIVDAIQLGCQHVALVHAPRRSEALRLECAKVRRGKEGTRNDTLNRAAFEAGQLVAGADLPRDDAEERLGRRRS